MHEPTLVRTFAEALASEHPTDSSFAALEAIGKSAAVMLLRLLSIPDGRWAADQKNHIQCMAAVAAMTATAAAVPLSSLFASGVADVDEEISMESVLADELCTRCAAGTHSLPERFAALSPRLQALLLLAALWPAAKLWASNLHGVSLHTLLFKLMESNRDTDASRSLPLAEAPGGECLSAPVDWGDGWVGDNMADHSRGMVRALEELEMVLLRCSDYTVPIVAP